MSMVRIEKEVNKLVERYRLVYILKGFASPSKQKIINTILKNSLIQRLKAVEDGNHKYID